jgi:DNA polymerase elongation subunit (family B)
MSKNGNAGPNLQTSDLEFQITDWNSYHELDDDDEHVYIIQLFGRTVDDKDICLRVTNFNPFFYIEIPAEWDSMQADDFVDFLKRKVSYRFKNNPDYEYDFDLANSLTNHKIVNKYKFYGFTNKKKFKFLMLGFKSYTGMREFSNILSRPIKMYGNCGYNKGDDNILFQRYESNIEPHIRFMHIKNLSSCGWIQIDKSKLTRDKRYSYCDLSYSVNWRYVEPSTGDPDRMAPFKIMAYDIECISCDENFCQADRATDKIIQIGVTMYRYGSLKCYDQHILVLKDCDEIKGANVECYKTEKGLLKGFADKIAELRPDFRTGYNITGFDDQYVYDRMKLLDKETARKKKIDIDNLQDDSLLDYFLSTAGKLDNKYLVSDYNAVFSDREAVGSTKYPTYFKSKNLSSSALGDNILNFFHHPGILTVDMMKVIQRDHKLTGYKLDNVSANFITEKAEKICPDTECKTKKEMIPIMIYTKSTKALELESYIQIMVNDGYSSSPLSENAKYKVTEISEVKEGDVILQAIHTKVSPTDYQELQTVLPNKLLKVFWTFAKDDMHHTLINKYFNEGNPTKIAQVAKYCLKDCKLANLLMAKLEIIVNNLGMAQVCHVPLSYLFLRGQGVKIFSLVSKKCREEKFLIPVLQRKKTDADGDDDVGYEGATVITPKPSVYFDPIAVLDYSSLYPNSMREKNLSQEMYVGDPSYDNLPGYKYHDNEIILKNKKGEVKRNLDGSPMKEYHRFAQLEDNEENNKKYGEGPKYGILPLILTELLNKRKAINNRLAEDKTLDSFKKNILNSLQLAYKITANSLYGQTGAPTSPIFFLPIAASTTATGRERLYFAKKMVEDNFKGSEIIYGDTDSIFINFHIRDLSITDPADVTCLVRTIELAIQAAKIINDSVPKPQSIVYEKTLWPLILASKKKYVGHLYEKDPKKFYLKSMGIVLKRRDNAPIVKIVVGGIIDYILKTRDIKKAINYTKDVIRKLMNGEYPIDKFIISKTLKSRYKKPQTIAHKVLADRMALRDPGNKPQVNDRIPFVYVVKKISKQKKKDVLQGDLIEHPEFVLKNGLKIDYLYYLEHQIINPALQILELMLPTKEVNKLFNEFIVEEWNSRLGRQDINKWIKQTSGSEDDEDWEPTLI